MKKYFFIILSFVLFFSCKNNNKDISKTNKDITIGIVLPLSGNAAVYGKAMKNGIELAYSESYLQNRIHLLFEDDKGEQKNSATVGQLFVSKKVDAIIGGAQSKTAEVLIPIIDKNKIPLISPGASSVDFDTISKLFFRLWPSDSYDGKIMANFIISSRKQYKIANFYTNSAYGVGLSKVFEKNIKMLGGNIVFSEPFSEGATDFKTQLLKIKNSGANALFIPGYIVEIKTILKQLQELNISIDIYGTSGFYDKSFAESLNNYKNEVFFSYPAFDISNNDVNTKSFVEKYKNKYGILPDVFAANAYDCYKVFDIAIQKGANTPIAIKDTIYKLGTIKGAGGSFSFDNNGNVKKDFVIYNISNGLFKKIEIIKSSNILTNKTIEKKSKIELITENNSQKKK